MPTGLADGLGLRSVRRSNRTDSPLKDWFPRAPPGHGSASADNFTVRPAASRVKDFLGTFQATMLQASSDRGVATNRGVADFFQYLGICRYG
jgi:hypothetical protein